MNGIFSEIVTNLQQINPLKIILFGSHAKGINREDSDIDLVVILDNNTIPENYDQKLELKVQVRDSIYEISRKIAIDLIVYTNGEYERLKELKTSFYNEIINTGKIIYEKTN